MSDSKNTVTGFITANGLMICPFDGRITLETRVRMYNYLEMFHLKGATFKIGCVEQYLTADDLEWI